MRCPFCACAETRVIDSRLAAAGEQIRRRRECSACEERFTSYESAELNLPRIIKSNGGREPFREEKLRAGMLRALEKRPVEMAQIDAAVARIKHSLRTLGEREVESGRVGDWVIHELRSIDQVAYVRFVSVYRSFADVDEFLDEIERLEGELPPALKKDQLNLLADEHNES